MGLINWFNGTPRTEPEQQSDDWPDDPYAMDGGKRAFCTWIGFSCQSCDAVKNFGGCSEKIRYVIPKLTDEINQKGIRKIRRLVAAHH